MKIRLALTLLLGWGAILTTGCSLDRAGHANGVVRSSNSNRADDVIQPIAWSKKADSRIGKHASPSDVSTNPSWQDANTKDGTITFRKPSLTDIRRTDADIPREASIAPNLIPSPNAAGMISLLPAGHSSDQTDATATSKPRQFALRSDRQSNASSQNDGQHVNSTDTPVESGAETKADVQTALHSDQSHSETNVTRADYRSDRDAVANPVQLQGFEVIPSNAFTATSSSTPFRPQPELPNLRIPLSTSNVSAPNGSAASWASDVERLIARTESELTNASSGTTPAERADYRRRQVGLRFLYLMAGRQEQALMTIPALEPAEQEYWQQLCWAAANSLDAERFPNERERAAQSISPLNSALRRLREQANLSIKNMAFCEQISYFGNYQKFAKDEFTPGQEVLLYAEIENFNTEQTVDGEHRTLLRSVIDISGSNGEARWHKTFPATEDRCRNARRDYFHNYQFAIPDRLPLGPHALKLTVVDDLSGKQASYSLRFMVK